MGTKKIIKPVFYKSRKDAPKEVQVLDIYADSLTELFFIEHPHLKKTTPNVEKQLSAYLKESKVSDSWIYVPWRNILIHTVEESAYFKLRTARNKNVINVEEQTNYRNIRVGIIGLSIGSVLLSSLVYTGGPKQIKLADFDTIEITNLNRMKGTLLDVTKNKAEVAAQNSWEIDPFMNLDVWTNSITKENIEDFILGNPQIDIFIDSMDSLELKVIARQLCKKAGITCLMATSNGDSEILDVERFDLEPDRLPFHGRLGDIKAEDLAYASQAEWIKKALQIVDESILTERVKQSIMELGKSLAGVPQLSTTLQISGAMISYAIRHIANKQDLPSGRYTASLEKIFKNE